MPSQLYNKFFSYLWLLVISLWTTHLGAQIQPEPEPQINDNWILNTDESSGSKNYIARDVIKLQTGSSTNFSFKATTGKSFCAKIDPGLLFPPFDKTYKRADGSLTSDPAQGAIVGSIPGQFDVSLSGAATYTIPIDVPAGINGMQPNFSLAYNSNRGLGTMGVGWDISGISTISKTVYNIFTDNKVSGIEDENMVYMLDGKRLVVKDIANINSTYTWPSQDDEFYSMVSNLAGSTYETLSKDYTKIESFGIAGYIMGAVNGTSMIKYDGPQSFKVTSKSGEVFDYFVTNDVYTQSGSHPLIWYLKKITDTNGNYVVYNYMTDEGQTILKNIAYTGNGLIEPVDSVIFNYETKPVDYSYIGSSVRANKFLLTEIIVKANNTLNKKYTISYKSSKNRYFVEKIKLTGSDNTQINATTLTWGTNSSEIGVCTKSIPVESQFQSVSNKSKYWLSADVNADGMDDVISLFPCTETINGTTQTKNYIQISKSTITNGETSFVNDSFYEIPSDFSFSDIKSQNPSIQFADLYGKNTENIIIPQLIQSGTSKIARFNIVGVGSVENTLAAGTEIPCYAFGDVNNDGKEEIIYIEKTAYNGNYPCVIGYNVNGQTIWEETSLALTDIPKSLIVKDFNNDGLTDFLVLTTEGYKIYKNDGGALQINGVIKSLFSNKTSENIEIKSSCDIIKTGDFNGDKLTDFIIKKTNSDWALALNNGKWDFFTDDSKTLNIYASVTDGNTSLYHQNQTDCMILDFDNDGVSDIVLTDNHYTYSSTPVLVDDDFYSYYQYNGTDIMWYRSTRDNFVQSSVVRTSDTSADYNKFFNMQGDFDGDGRGDILVYGRDVRNGVNKTDQLYLHGSFNANFNSDLLTSVTNGMGNEVQFKYQPITYTTTADNKPFYTKGTSASYPLCDFQAPIYCVSKTLTPNGLGQWLTTEYAYSEAQKQLTGIGYLGFKTNTKALVQFNKKLIATYDKNSTNYYPDKITQEVFTLTDSPVSKKETEYSHTLTGKVIETKLTKSFSKDYLTGLQQTTEYLDYDNYGNPEIITTTTGSLSTKKIISYVQRGSHCPNKPETVTVTTTKGTEKYERISGYTYDSKGNLTSKTTDSGDPNQLTVQYEQFNEFGQPALIKSSANGATRSVSIIISDSKKYAISKTDVLGQTTIYNWNESLGVINSQTDRFGETTCTYNGFGRLLNVRSANGLQSNQAIQWAEAGNPYNAAYFIYAQSSGSGPVTVWYDAFGRELVKEVVGLNGNISRVFTEYDALGRVHRVSEPTFATSPQNWAVTYAMYDTYGRIKTINSTAGTTEMTYDGLTTTVTTPNGTKQTTLNTTGQVEATTINDKSVSYTYYPSGLLKSSTPQNGQTITMLYDLQGNRTHLFDPDLGTIRTAYNGFGELLLEKQLIHNASDSISTIYNYEGSTGILESKVLGNETTVYGYDDLKRLRTIEIAGKHKQTLTYGDFDRVTNVKEEIDGRIYNKTVGYDFFGRVKKQIFPSGYSVSSVYDKYSNLTEMKDNATTIYKPLEANARGQLTQLQKGTVTTTYGYNDRGMTETIVAPGIVNMEYEFNTRSNLEYRIDHLTNQREDFVHDELNRLTNWNVTHNGITTFNSITYNTSGNIESKSDVGNLTFAYGEGNGKPHALTSISGVPANFPTQQLTATYTDFKKLKVLSNNNSKNYEISYGVDEQRRKSVYKENGVTKLTRYYMGDYEEEITASNVRKIHYLSGAIYVDNSNANDSLYYVYTDNQGSVIAMTDESGNVKRKYAYNPWGVRRNADNWNETDNLSNLIINRGYTGHEHLDQFGIINMNGRVYDPLTAQFLSPDPFLQAPDQWLNYNRYGYVMSSPMAYTDPSGYRHKTAQELEIDEMNLSYSPEPFWVGRYMGRHESGSGGGGPSGWNPGASTRNFYGSFTWNYETKQFEYGNGMQASSSDVASFFENATLKADNEPDRIYGYSTITGNFINGFKLNGVIYEFSKPVKYGEKIGVNLTLKEWGAGEYIGALSMIMGATGNQIGSHMSEVSRFAPLSTLDGKVVAQATSRFRFGFIPGTIATKLGAGLRIGGNLLGGFGILYTGYQIGFNGAPVGKGLVDIGFGVVGFLGPVGLGISAIYFVGDTFIPGGWQAVPQHQYNEIQMNSRDGVWYGAHNHFK